MSDTQKKKKERVAYIGEISFPYYKAGRLTLKCAECGFTQVLPLIMGMGIEDIYLKYRWFYFRGYSICEVCWPNKSI